MSPLDPGWLQSRLRVLLLVTVALAWLVVPPLTGGAGATDDRPGLAADGEVSGSVADDLTGAITDDGRVELTYFGADTCPFCQQMELYLDDLEEAFAPPLELTKHEVSDPVARDRWETAMRDRGQEPSGVPTTILGDRIWVGYDEQVARDITRAVATLVAAVDGTPGSEVEAPEEDPAPPDAATDTAIAVPVVGEVELAGRSAVGVTALIAFVDGFNPCSLWVLAILLAMVLNAGASRARVVAVGVTFLTVTGLIYGAFIVGVFTVVGLLTSITAIGWVVGGLALVIGVVNIKDYFAYKQGLSLTIPDRFKPRIYRGGRAIRDQERPLAAVLGTTVVLAAGVALIELPCTMGFPLVWTGTIQTLGIDGGPAFAGLLALYLAVYVGLELVLFGVVIVTMRVTRMEERHGRVLKLIGGSLMVVLGAAMVWFRTLLDDLAGLLLLTVLAAGLAVLLALVQRLRGGPGPHEDAEQPEVPVGGRRDGAGGSGDGGG